MRELADGLDELRAPVGRIAELRRVAELGDDLGNALDAVAELTWVLDDDLWDTRCALEALEQHRPTLERMCDLDDLADDLAAFLRDLRQARQHEDDLNAAADELEEPGAGAT